MTKILNDCRDLAVHRLLLSFSSVLDRVSDVLMDRASKTDIRDEQQMFLDARQALKTERANLMADFEKKLRRTIDDRVAGKEEVKADFSKIDSTMLTLVDTSSMDESVITGNIIRVVENLCHDELLSLNRGIGHLLGKPDLETPDNPLAPSTIVHAFSDALKNVKTENRIKFQILKELNQAPLSDINAIYADLNRHLTNLRMMPSGRGMPHRAADRGRPGAPGTPPQQPVPPASPEVDVMALFRRMASQGSFPMAGRAPQAPAPSQQQMPPGFPNFAGGAPPAAPGELPQIDYGAAMPPAQAVPSRTFAPMAPTPSGYIPGAPIMATPALHEGLTRLQAGQSGFDVEGAMVTFSGIPEGLHNVLRDLQESPLGQKANQLESMTIEMVAMLFDFVFETKDLPDGIKALLARLQIPVLKAAMLDGAFFAKKTHPARLLVNALAEAGLGWSPMMGNEDPLYRKIEKIVHGILDGFSNDLAIFDDLREELETFLAAEEKLAEANIATTAEEITRRDRQQIATNVARSEVERRIESYPIPNFLAQFLRTKWQSALEHSYQQDGEDSEVWSAGVTTLEDLVWSVQPKKTPEDRKHLVALLPSLLKRLSAGMQTQSWPQEERESFMANLVEAHAAAVKPSLSAVPSPTAAVAEQAKVQAEIAKASGDTVGAAKAEALAVAMTPAEPAAPEAEAEVLDDEYLEIARSLERGAWVEFEGEDGQLAFAKLAWVSPLRGTYLFTNRQGQKALSMTAEELAERFRADRARLVEAEPLIDRAFSSVLTQLNEKFGEETAAA
ncbi:MAG TPA: DUF1631 domain-containing protein [Casimicrobiaceae bacterium]|jgi:Protein of unknown function (DUF1631)|nr:DUF1631 domain-containing protein [Casimicrobiaceae bacterium]